MCNFVSFVEQLDATEFELPQVAELPTLESILNEPDEADINDDILYNDCGAEYHDYSGSDCDDPLQQQQRDSPANSERKAPSFSSEAETVSVHSRNSSRSSADLLMSLACGGSQDSTK